jgi:hypothetical protein
MSGDRPGGSIGVDLPIPQKPTLAAVRWRSALRPVRCLRLQSPLIEHWERLAGWQPEDDGAARLAKLENALAPYRLPREEAVPLFASLLSLPLGDSYLKLGLTQEQLKEQTADALA